MHLQLQSCQFAGRTYFILVSIVHFSVWGFIMDEEVRHDSKLNIETHPAHGTSTFNWAHGWVSVPREIKAEWTYVPTSLCRKPLVYGTTLTVSEHSVGLSKLTSSSLSVTGHC